MEFNISVSGNERKINLSGRLTFQDNEAFRTILGSFNDEGPDACSFELADLEFIDSAGLGMLLLVKDAAESSNLKVTLFHPKGQVKQMLEITRFHELIEIQS